MKFIISHAARLGELIESLYYDVIQLLNFTYKVLQMCFKIIVRLYRVCRSKIIIYINLCKIPHKILIYRNFINSHTEFEQS